MKLEGETYNLVGMAMEVHTILGKGYLEAVYHEAMMLEMTARGIPFVSQPKVNIRFKHHVLNKFYIPDFMCYGCIPLEIKAHSDLISKADLKQIMNSLRVCGGEVGLLFNFGREALDYRRVMFGYDE